MGIRQAFAVGFPSVPNAAWCVWWMLVVLLFGAADRRHLRSWREDPLREEGVWGSEAQAGFSTARAIVIGSG